MTYHHGIMPIWLINGPIDRSYIISELDEVVSKGITEVVVRPSDGLTVEYPSDEWFGIFGWILEESEARGLQIWIYDQPNDQISLTVDPEMMRKYISVEVTPRDEIDTVAFQPGQFLIAAKMQGGRVAKTRVLEDMATFRNLDESWHIFNCRIKRDECCIDALSQRTIDRHKESTHEEYRVRFSQQFGKTIRGFFAADPSPVRGSLAYEWTIPYTEKLFPTFELSVGYSAIPLLPHLFYPSTEAPAFRADFWGHIAELFNTNYHGNVADWCLQNGLLYVGQGNSANPVGDAFGSMKTMDIPGIKQIGKETLGNESLSVAVQKIASSTAHSDEKPYVISESFAHTSWDTCYLDLKKIVDWHFSQGINLLAPHALYHTIAGQAKRDCPPSFFIQSPLWKDFDAFLAYVGRLSDFFTGGKHICHIAILHPYSGLCSAYQPDRKTQEFEMVDNFLNQLCIELMNRQLDYDLVDFATLSSAAIEDKKLSLADEKYDILLVPATPYMRANEYDAIKRIGSEIETYFFYRTVDPTPANVPSDANGVHFVATEELPSFVMRLRHAIDDGIHINGIGREDILLLQREKDGKRIIFMANRSEHVRKISARFTEQTALRLVEPETGATHPIGSKLVGKKAEAVIHFGPYQSWILVAGEEPIEQHHVEAKMEEIELKNPAAETAENVALVFNFRYDETDEKVDVRKESGATDGTYEANIHIEGKPGPVRMVLDHDYSRYRIIINGTEVIPMPTQNWLVDPSDISADVTSLLKEGENNISVIAPEKLSEPLKFCGDFDVSAGEVITIKPHGDRDMFALEKSMPFYSGTVTYTADFEVSEQPERIELSLTGARDSASVYVNGVLAGKRLWPPYVFDLTEFIKVGKNDLRIEVRNNMANLILGKHRAFGLRNEPKVHELRVTSGE